MMKIELSNNLSIGFPEYPSDCDRITITTSTLSKTLTAEMLSDNSLKAIKDTFSSLDLTVENGYFIIPINHRDIMKIEVNGDHICFMREDIEQYFWNADELQEAPEEVMGAITGYLTQAYTCPINNVKLDTNKALSGYQVINERLDTYDHESYEVIAQLHEAEAMLIQARTEYPDFRWVIEPMYR